MTPSRRRTATLMLLAAIGAATGACNSRINIGNAVLFSAEQEAGDFSEWTAGGKGGYSADLPDTSVTISTAVAHRGTHSVKLSNAAATADETARLWRNDDFPEEAYYSAWYYLPRSFVTATDWTIMQFRGPPAADASTPGQIIDVDLRSLPNGDLILTIYDHRPQYLRAPTPPDEVAIPIAEWFQIEVLYRNVGDDSGHFTLWLNGRVQYDFARPFGADSAVNWSPCSSTEGLTPLASDLYVDDAAVSAVRVTPTGSL